MSIIAARAIVDIKSLIHEPLRTRILQEYQNSEGDPNQRATLLEHIKPVSNIKDVLSAGDNTKIDYDKCCKVFDVRITLKFYLKTWKVYIRPKCSKKDVEALFKALGDEAHQNTIPDTLIPQYFHAA